MLGTKKYGFCEQVKKGQELNIGTRFKYMGFNLEVTEIKRVDFVTNEIVLVSGYGKEVKIKK